MIKGCYSDKAISVTMVPVNLILVVGMVFGVEVKEQGVNMKVTNKETDKVTSLLACPEREGGGWLACGEEGRCISKTQVNQAVDSKNMIVMVEDTSEKNNKFIACLCD